MAERVETIRPAPGVVELEPGLFRFTLYAPRKKHVAVVGPWNEWNVHLNMLTQVDEGLWTAERQFDEGEHVYQYVVDGVRVVDPYAREMYWPSGVANHEELPLGVLRIGAREYVWRNDAWQRPHYQDLVFYETHIGDFSEQGTFHSLTDKLDYLSELGINALEIMPVWEGALNEGWGYQPIGFFACKSSYGTSDDFKELVDEAHGRGIAVLLDVVLSHTAKSHTFNRLYPANDSPWYGQAIGGPNIFNMPSFDHRKPAVREFCRQVQEHWLREYHVDGFRYDYAINIGIAGEYGLPTVVRQVRAVMPKAYLIAEHLPERPDIMRLCDLDGAWHVRSCYTFRVTATHKDQDEFQWGNFKMLVRYGFDPLAEGWPKASSVMNYIESHDEFRLAHYLADMGLREDEIRKRVELAAWALFTAPGVPMLYHGEEICDASVKAVNVKNPIQWGLLDTDSGKQWLSFWRRLIRFYHIHPALRSDDYAIERVMEAEKCLVYRRSSWDGDFVIFAGNFSDYRHKVPVALPARGTWEDVVHNREYGIKEEKSFVEIDLDGRDAAVFVRQ